MSTKIVKFCVAAPMFVLVSLFVMNAWSEAEGFAAISALLSLILYIYLAAVLFMKRLDNLLLIGAVGFPVLSILRFINDINYLSELAELELIDLVEYYSPGFRAVTIASDVLYLVGALGVLAVVASHVESSNFLTNIFSKFDILSEKLWFLPMILLTLGSVFLTLVYSEEAIEIIGQTIGAGLALMPWLFLCKWVIAPYKFTFHSYNTSAYPYQNPYQQQPYQQNPYQQPQTAPQDQNHETAHEDQHL